MEQVAGFYRDFRRAAGDNALHHGINQSASGSDKCNAIINVHLASGNTGVRAAGRFR
jgi:assimilatory nitrate reductase catalytic subunit